MAKIKDTTEGLEDGDLPSSSGTFWGVTMQGGKSYSQKSVSPFHISMAALEPSTDPEAVNTLVTVWLSTKGCDYLLCTLKHDSLYNMSLNYELDVGEELDLYINGKGTVYLTGYIRRMDDPPPQYWEMDSEDDGGVIEFPESEESDDEVVLVKSKSKRKAKKQEDTENPKKKAKKEVEDDLLPGKKQKSSESGSKVEISRNNNVQSTRSSSAAQPRPNSVVTSSVQDYATLPHFDRNDRGYIVAYTNGCCRNNGKPNAAAGIGVYWYHNCPLNVSKPLSGVQTNNRAELQACVVALKTAKENNLNKIEIRTDSNFVKAGITLWILKWKANGWKSSTGDVKNKEDWQELDDIRNQMDVEWTWVMAHGGNPGNEMAYKLANAGADKH